MATSAADLLDALRISVRDNDRLRRENQRLAEAAREPIAIVAAGCRFPGGITDPDGLWRLLAGNDEVVGPLPTDRGWRTEDLPVGRGGFLAGVGDTDAAFFGLAPREALAADPQQRLCLEVAWETLERAGIVPGTLRGSDTGVFVGATHQHYGPCLHQAPEQVEGYVLTGTTTSVLSGRVSYVFGFEGPSVTIDTACSSSLVSLHDAVRALRAGECSLALAGGVTVMSTPGLFREFGRQGGLSADGRCKAFAEGADGTGWSEGAALLLLERLSQARERGHPVLAVVRGSAINSDGASNGLTAPSGPAQQRVIRAALADAGLEPSDVDSVEAHGTGTALGDPIEAQALLATYGKDRPGQPLSLASVKSNLGHVQGAAGVAGVLRIVLALRAELLPATLHADQPTSAVDWSSGSVALLTGNTPWRRTARPRRAGVSSFGISGTNAHVILEQAPDPEPVQPAEPALGALPLLLSGRSGHALRDAATRLRAWLADRPDVDLTALARTLALARTAFPHRAAVVGEDREDLLRGLAALSDAEPATSPVGRGRTDVVFVFPGQGTQWPGMARELLDTSPVFAERVRDCEHALDRYVDWSLTSVLRGEPDAPGLDRVDVVQPALFAVLVSLAALWQAHGVRPSAVVGHSQGEIAAACVAGVLTLDDAARVVALRSRLLAGLTGGGGMLSVASSADRVAECLRSWRDGSWQHRVSIAVINGPEAVVLAGDAEALAALREQLAADEIRTWQVAVDYAAHSGYVEPVLDRLRTDLAAIDPHPAEVPFVSSVTGRPVEGTALDAGYWARNLREPVDFAAAVRHLLDRGLRCFVEVSPHPVLLPAIGETGDAAGKDLVLTGTLHREHGDLARLRTALAELHTRGVPVDWTSVFGAGPILTGDLPTYPFQRRRFWLSARDLPRDGHPLLDEPVDLPDGATLLTGRVSVDAQGWLADHVVGGAPLFPGAGFAELALHAASVTGAGGVAELVIGTPLAIPPDILVALQVLVAAPDPSGARALLIRARAGAAAWSEHATGTLAPVPLEQSVPVAPGDAAGAARAHTELAARGYAYGPAFRGLCSARVHEDEVTATVTLPPEAGPPGRFVVHPALLDAVVQAAVLLEFGPGLWLPFAWSGLAGDARGVGTMHVTVRRAGEETVSVHAADENGQPVLSVATLVLRPADPSRLGSAGSLLATEWVPVPDLATVPPLRWSELGAAAPGPAPDAVVHQVRCASGDAPDAVVTRTLRMLRSWLAGPDTATTLVVVTTGLRSGQGFLAGGVPGLVRSAQTEHPGRMVLLDLDDSARLPEVLAAALASGEPELAVCEDRLCAPRLRDAGAAALAEPAGPWRLDFTHGRGLTEVVLAKAPDATRPLAPGEVRIDVRAAGVNFRDVLVALGTVPAKAGLPGSEGAGVVVEVGPGVSDLAEGDRVLGLFAGGVGPVSIADHRLVVPLPANWSYASGAAAPVAFLTALVGLREYGRVRPGDRVLVHAVTGGVGMAAAEVTRMLGARVAGTAAPAKWPVARERGVLELASSRDAGFERVFAPGVDVVLNSLTGDLVDASLRLLAPGGRFVEMGKRDVRDPRQIAERHEGVTYQAFDVGDLPATRLGELIAEIVGALRTGALTPVPNRTWGVGRVREAYRHMAAGEHVGKIVLRSGSPLSSAGTVLVTGGTGSLGREVVGWLLAEGVRHVVVLSRGGAPEDAPDWPAECVEFVRCDVADRAALAEVLAAIPNLRCVIHAAGVLADGIVESMTEDLVREAFGAKAMGALWLHELTGGLDLDAFVLFSSAAGTVGNAGQGAYAAANTFLDGLATFRRSRGLPAVSLAWGPWRQDTGMTAGLREQDVARTRRAGMAMLAAPDGLRLLDLALRLDLPIMVPALLDRAALREPGRAAVLRELTGAAPDPVAPTPPGASVIARLAGLSAVGRRRAVLDLVRVHLAGVLGHAVPQELDPAAPLKELGLDSLTGVELRNRLATATGLRLPVTAVYNHPTPEALAAHVEDLLAEGASSASTVETRPGAALLTELDRVSAALERDGAGLGTAVHDEIAARLAALAREWIAVGSPASTLDPGDDLVGATDDELFAALRNELDAG